MGAKEHPRRKKDKYNPYTLSVMNGHCYLYFKDGFGISQQVEIDNALYCLFDKFELEDISYLNCISRHMEHFQLTDEALNDRTFYQPESLEESVEKRLEFESLHKAILKLPEAQKRRILLYFFCDKTYGQIAKMEGCKYQAVQCSIQAALKTLKKILK